MGVLGSYTKNTRMNISLVGEYGCGKSSLISRITTGQFIEQQPTISNERVNTCIDGTVMTFIDPSGVERFGLLTSTAFRANVVMITFDLSSPNVSDSLQNWYTAHCRYASPITKLILVGLKADLCSNLPNHTAKEFAQEHSIDYIETSSKLGLGIKEVLNTIQTLSRPQHKPAPPTCSINLSTFRPKQRKKPCIV